MTSRLRQLVGHLCPGSETLQVIVSIRAENLLQAQLSKTEQSEVGPCDGPEAASQQTGQGEVPAWAEAEKEG